MEGNNHQKRAKNFVNSEKRVLVKVASEYIDIIENKQTDAQNVQIKKKTWDIITERFNRTSITGSRTSKQLKALYDSLKKIAKKSSGSPPPSIRNEVEPSKVLQILQMAVSSGSVDERIPIPVPPSRSPQLLPLHSPFDSSAPYLASGPADNEGSNLDPLHFTMGSSSEEKEDTNSISVHCSPDHTTEQFEEAKCSSLPTILNSPKKENQEENSEAQVFSLDFANEENTVYLEEMSQPCHEEPRVPRNDTQAQKRRGVQMIADRFIKRKNVKDTYDMELHEQRMRLLRKELEIKEIELENKSTEIEMTKKIKQLEYEIKHNELEIVQMDKKIKEIDFKIKTQQYAGLKNS